MEEKYIPKVGTLLFKYKICMLTLLNMIPSTLNWVMYVTLRLNLIQLIPISKQCSLGGGNGRNINIHPTLSLQPRFECQINWQHIHFQGIQDQTNNGFQDDSCTGRDAVLSRGIFFSSAWISWGELDCPKLEDETFKPWVHIRSHETHNFYHVFPQDVWPPNLRDDAGKALVLRLP